ncbi:MAG: 2-oxo acid dehydrogenase subunit E2 [Flavobacteriaceae bacterium]|jgi:2-oxoglutarate dehydrogenase E2 component (dihydrolipoamide succinyltransferase)|nr:2-oxo acid dehydrogenase subunit E2 [Flavobacteriaceae bacterium]
MAEYKLVLPAMGEGIMEATVTGWVKNEGDSINEDEIVIEIATDKVDSEIPSPVSGRLIRKLKNTNDICQIGEVFAILEIEGENTEIDTSNINVEKSENQIIEEEKTEVVSELEKPLEETIQEDVKSEVVSKELFLSPLIKSICREENISHEELVAIQGTGLGGRITKSDLMSYLKNQTESSALSKEKNTPKTVVSASVGDEIIEMDRMRKLIAEHMIASKQTSVHVTSFIEADVTNIVLWRNKNKDIFLKKEGEKLTFMPVFVQAVVKAIKEFPMVNISVDGDKIIKKKNINIGMAAALPNGNLIVPVIKNADQLSLSGLAKVINDLAARARNNRLKPDEIKGGTYTITNLGSFGNLMGTPIINQPEAAILAVGAIVKKPAVIETPQGDLIGIRHKMYLSHTYDHRVIDGALGGMFVKSVCDELENFDPDTEI